MFPFLPKRAAQNRRPWPTVAVVTAAFLLYLLFEWHASGGGESPLLGEVERLSMPRRAPDAGGRAGDLVVRAPGGASLTAVAAPDIAGHRPLLGAIVDVGVDRGDASDPLIWLRTAPADADNELADTVWRSPQPFTCNSGGAGVRAYGPLGTGLEEEICVGNTGLFGISTKIGRLKEGSSLADQLDVGSLPVIVAGGLLLEGEVETPFVAFGGAGVGVAIEGTRIRAAHGSPRRFGPGKLHLPVVMRYEGTSVTRYVHVVRGDALAAIAALPSAKRVFDVTFGPGRGGTVSLRDGADVEIAQGHVSPGSTRTFRLPPGLGDHAVLRDDRGMLTDGRVELPAPGKYARIVAAAASPGRLSLEYHDASGAPLAVHVLFKGVGGTPDPVFVAASGRTVCAGRSLYLLDGRTTAPLPAGHYRLTASHGTAYTLSVNDVAITAGSTASAEGTLRAVVDTTGWVSGDFHLHAAPSYDSVVSLEERVQSLAAEGVELAVATDHNRVTDYSPAVRALGLSTRLDTAPGVEVTSAGRSFGHFNAYPMPVPTGSPEEGTPAYFDRLPQQMFAAARRLGARVVQVNHARMPNIGYFALTRLDERTGRSSGEFSSDFDVFEAFNGALLEKRDEVRNGARDLVALARRGKLVAAVGDSDSHKLLYEEAGYPRTYVHTPAEPAGTRFERAAQALLKTRDTTITSGPFVELTVDGHDVGSIVEPGADSVHVSVRVSAPAWVPVERVELWRDDVVWKTFAVGDEPKDGLRFSTELDVPLDGADRTILAWADAETPLPDVVPADHALSIGFTGLVYVDTNRDGRVVVPPAGR